MSSKNDSKHSEKLQRWLRINERSLRCLAISAVCHIFFIIFFYFFVLPAAGHPEATLLDVSFETGASQDQNDVHDNENSPIPIPQEDDFENTQDTQKALKDLQKSMELSTNSEFQEYLKTRKQKIAQKKKLVASLAAQQNKITGALKQRSRYGTLRPRTFYGVNIYARNMIFVLDVSGSMNIREARRQLINAYQALTEKEHFNLIIYADSVTTWHDHLVKATRYNRKQANMWVRDIRSGGGTNMYTALQRAFQVAWEKTKAETIYLLSDGLPTSGPIQDPLQILSSVKKWNANKNIIINTIGIGPQQDKHFLSALAKENHGRYFVR